MDKMGWKVVRKNNDGSFESAVVSGKWSRPYATGSRVVGLKDTPVLAFRTRQTARDFYRFGASQIIFRALLENPQSQDFIADPFFPLEFHRFWRGGHTDNFPAPDGTLACDAITLLEPAR